MLALQAKTAERLQVLYGRRKIKGQRVLEVFWEFDGQRNFDDFERDFADRTSLIDRAFDTISRNQKFTIVFIRLY